MSDTKTTRQAGGTEVGGAGVPKRRWLRRLIVAGVLLLIVLVVLVLLVPTLLSTGAGKRFVLGVVNDQITGEVDADGLSVGWLSGQSLTGVVVRDGDGAEVARVGRVELADASLLSLVRGELSLGELQIESVTADIVGYEDGTTNLQRALAGQGVSSTPSGTASPGKSPPGTTSHGKSTPGSGGAGGKDWPSGLSFGLVVRDVDIAYKAEGVAEPIRLAVSEADLSAKDPSHLVLKLSAELSQGQHVGTLTADAEISQLFDAAGVYQSDIASTQINADVTDLPIELLDTLLAQDGKLLALLGPVLNGHVRADVTAGGGTASITANSENLDINGKVAFGEDGVTNDGESAILLTLTPDAWTALTVRDSKQASTLSESVEVVIKLRSLGLPIGDDGLDTENVSLDFGLTIGDTRLLIDGVGEVTLTSTTGDISTTQLDKLLAASFHTTSGINRKPGGVEVDIQLADLLDANQGLNTAGLSAKINGVLTNAPIAAILDELMPGVTRGLATRSLGPTVDARLKFNAAPRSDSTGMAGGFDLDILTEGGEAGLNSTLIGSFQYDKNAIQATLIDGSYARFTLTPELLAAYGEAFGESDERKAAKDTTSKADVTLGAPATFKLDLTHASAEMLSIGEVGYELNPDSLMLTGKLSSTGVRVDQAGKRAATLKDLLVDIKSSGLAGETRMVLNANVNYPTLTGDAPKPGLIESTTTVSGLVGDDGAIELSSASYQTDTQIRQAPIDLIDSMLDLKGELVASVGPRALLKVDGVYSPGEQGEQGGFDLLLKSRSASADMKLLMENGLWALKADAPLSFRVTPRLSQTMLKKVNPFLGGALSAKLPIGVTVKQEGFSVPLHDAGVADVNADFKLELGELDLRGEGVLKDVLEQLGVSDNKLLNAKFSPVVINLVGGKLSYTDLTMTMDDVVLGFSGDVDLNSERLDLRMTIPGTSLANIKWLRGAIPPDQVIVIPLTGTFDKPALDFKLLSGEIAKAALQGQLKGTVGDAIGDEIGGEAGTLLGGLLGELLTGQKPQEQDTTDGSVDVSAEVPSEVSAEVTSEQQAELDAQEAARKKRERQAANQLLTEEERAERRERWRKRRERLERLEREQAQRDAQQAQP